MTHPHTFRVENVFRSLSGLPADSFMTEFVIGGANDDSAGTLAGIMAGILDTEFYNWVDVGHGSLKDYLSSAINRATDQVEVRVYDITTHLDGSDAGSPTSVATYTLGATANESPMPEEVAACLSYHGDLAGLPEKAPNPAFPPTLPKFFRPKARHRGRIYVGPLEHDTVAGPVGGHVYVDPTFATVLADAGANLAAALDGLGTPGDWAWVVWSRANAATYNIVGGWVDNAFDTQRRRGAAPNGRTLFSYP